MSNLKNDLPSHSDASCLFEGMTSINAIIHAIESGTNDRQILRIFFDRDKTTSKSRELAFLRKESEKLGFHIEFTNSTVIDKITTGTTHGGIVAECTKRAYPVLDATFVRQDGFYVFLDGIEDPYNFGYVLRSLYAAGVDGVVLSERNWMSAAGTVARASAGTSNCCPSALQTLRPYRAFSANAVTKFLLPVSAIPLAFMTRICIFLFS